MADVPPFVTAIVPCRNEAKHIERCLCTLVNNDFPADRLEILVVDGMSTDGTRALVEEFAAAHQNLRMIDNPSGIIPAAMNTGIRAAKGGVILKVDAHASYPAGYVRRTIDRLVESGADCVGGVLITEASAHTAVAHSIAFVLAHPFGSGNSRFRTGSPEPVEADTAAFGCYRREVFDRVGGYDERLVRSSDMDLNTRLRIAGGTILLDPAISATYYPRGTAGAFLWRNLLDGFWALYPKRFGSPLARPRHLAPAIALTVAAALLAAAPFSRWAALVLAAATIAYALAATTIAVRAAISQRRPSFLALVPAMFAMRHAAYAAGSLFGLARAVTSIEYWQHDARSAKAGA